MASVSAPRKRTSPPTRGGFVLETLRDAILAGAYDEGAKLDQRQIADDLGVSMIPVRESLRQLEAEGLVQIRPYRGAFVAQLSATELEQIYLIREVLEELATRLAVPLLSAVQLDQLEATLLEMERATAADDFAALFELNRRFHFTIYGASGNPPLVQIISGLWDRSAAYRRMYTYLRDRTGSALVEHRAIYAQCRAGDPAGAANAVRLNVHQTTRGILERLRAASPPAADSSPDVSGESMNQGGTGTRRGVTERPRPGPHSPPDSPAGEDP